MSHKILHLCTDGNFIEHSISVFEHFYPNQNLFSIKPKKGGQNATFVKYSDAVWFNPFKNKYYLDMFEQMDQKEQFDIIVVHGMSESFNEILKRINPDKKKKVFWMFWGYEMYYSLGEEGKFPLIDNPSPFSVMSYITPTRYNCLVKKLFRKELSYKCLADFLPLVDYFCFWLYEDYLLLKKYYPNSRHLQYRHFTYSSCYEKDKAKDIQLNFNKVRNEIRVSHSASKTANHVTVMKILNQVDKENIFKKVFPLAYGSERIRRNVIRLGKKYFGSQFVPQLKYVSSDLYFDELSKVSIAIFGQLRQEAAGNIFPLVRYGAKVFMRKENPLYKYFIRKGYVVFSVEDDLKSINDLSPLTHEQMIQNANVAKKNQMTYEDFMPSLFD